MNVTHALAPHLPDLRRYARALTGSQESGDAYVRAALTALLAGEQVLDTDLSPRVALYKLFHQIWSSPASHYDASTLPAEDGSNNPEGRLLALSASRRAALLLTAVESFSLDEAGAILGENPEEVERAIVEAQRAVEAELISRVPSDQPQGRIRRRCSMGLFRRKKRGVAKVEAQVEAMQ